MTIEDVARYAAEQGFTEEAQIVAQAIVMSEGGPNAGLTPDDNGGPSAGPLQFHSPGQLDNYAAFLNTTPTAAGQYAISHPDEAVKWALANYLGDAIREGERKGKRGADLAYYVAQFGQVTAYPERAKQWFIDLFGGATAPNSSPAGSGNGGGNKNPASFGCSSLISTLAIIGAIVIGLFL